ncbi:MAG TPA: phosphopentomutase [Solibacterales bacterium]|nr:phosphopentomutase [Bryobacterales bacterium]
MTMQFRRVVWIVLDSVGMGALPDAAGYGDAGADTLGHIAAYRRLSLPNLCHLGLANIRDLNKLEAVTLPLGCYGRCALASPGKDTTTGHWEMAGIHLQKPFPVYPQGFPREIVETFEARTGRRVLGNYPASGTTIIRDLGEEHMRTGALIVYTSADSVFQIAAHEAVVPLEELYEACSIARDILRGEHEVGRVIARPFVGEPGAFIRTSNRHDYAVPPPQGMLLDRLAEAKVKVHTVGKIDDVFLGRGVTSRSKTKNNGDGMQKTLDAMTSRWEGLIWTNLVDFDQQYGHRNDVEGYAKALEDVDLWIPYILDRLTGNDLLIITADHGCDPTTPGTDHTREYVPLLVHGPHARRARNLGDRASLADIGQTVARNFGVSIPNGESFLEAIAG